MFSRRKRLKSLRLKRTLVRVIIIAEPVLSLLLLTKLVWSLLVLAWPLIVLVVPVYPLVLPVWPLLILIILVFPIVVLVYPLLVLVFPLVVLVCPFVCPFVVLVCPLVVSVSPLVVPVVLPVSLFITDPYKLLLTYIFWKMLFIGQNLKHNHMRNYFLELLIFFWLTLVNHASKKYCI